VGSAGLTRAACAEADDLSSALRLGVVLAVEAEPPRASLTAFLIIRRNEVFLLRFFITFHS